MQCCCITAAPNTKLRGGWTRNCTGVKTSLLLIDFSVKRWQDFPLFTDWKGLRPRDGVYLLPIINYAGCIHHTHSEGMQKQAEGFSFIRHECYKTPDEWRKLHNEDLSDLYSLPNIVRVVKSRRMRWVGHVALMGEGRGVHRVMVGKPEGKRPLGRPRRRWKDNIKIDLQEVRGGCEDWM